MFVKYLLNYGMEANSIDRINNPDKITIFINQLRRTDNASCRPLRQKRTGYARIERAWGNKCL